MNTTAYENTTQQQYVGSWSAGTTGPFEGINSPGCYICNWSGHLLRVPQDGVAPGQWPWLNMVGNDPLFVTKISDNPYLPVTKARLLAANFNVNANF